MQVDERIIDDHLDVQAIIRSYQVTERNNSIDNQKCFFDHPTTIYYFEIDFG